MGVERERPSGVLIFPLSDSQGVFRICFKLREVVVDVGVDMKNWIVPE